MHYVDTFKLPQKLHTQQTLAGQVCGHSSAFIMAQIYGQISADNIKMTSLSKACVCVLTCKEEKQILNRSS